MSAGRPTLLDDRMKNILVELAKFAHTDVEMAQIVGVHPSTIYNWRNAHPEFFESLKEAKRQADAVVEASLYKRAVGLCEVREEEYFETSEGNVLGEKKVKIKKSLPDVTAQIFWLKNRQPDKWREKQEIESLNKNIEIKIDSDDSDL